MGIPLLGQDEGRSTWELGGLAILKWSPELPVAPAFGLEFGVLARGFSEDGDAAATVAVPIVALDAGASIRLADSVRLEPQARFRLDLLRTMLSESPGSAPVQLSPISIQAGVSISLLPPVP